MLSISPYVCVRAWFEEELLSVIPPLPHPLKFPPCAKCTSLFERQLLGLSYICSSSPSHVWLTNQHALTHAQ